MAILELKKATKVIHNGPNEHLTILDHVNLKIAAGQFVTVLGGNGAGKSTLFNAISGSLSLTSGDVFIKEKKITKESEEKRAAYLARVFQDPKMGTAPRMTVAENLLLAQKRGQSRKLVTRNLQNQRELFIQLCAEIGNGLENHLDTPTGLLSGGQRQALSLLMATIQKPDLLLLDEHTAALDPKTSRQLMTLTDKKIQEEALSCLMITHRMEDALNYGNRLLVLKNGRIVQDLDATEKQQLTLSDLLLFFEEMEELPEVM
ncbi:ABC transporter ATP-binding protein [Enterococcus sp. HY326]|uniref:ABC transporter ATP-binding protein n=1 Tax=Enterococcus sp. HY326 TaxID=2971265 RepID=UPI003A10349C